MIDEVVQYRYSMFKRMLSYFVDFFGGLFQRGSTKQLAAYLVQEVSQPELTWANLKTIAVLFWQLVLIGDLLFDV